MYLLVEEETETKLVKKNTIGFGTTCFYIFWITLLVGKGLGYSSINKVFQMMTWCVIPFAILKLVVTKWDKNEFIICIVVNTIGICVWINSGSADILLSTIAITACKDINLQKLFKLSFWIKGSMFVLMSTLSFIGVVEAQTRHRYDLGTNTIRYGLGYGQPNATHYTLFIIVVLALLVYHQQMKWFHYIALFIYNIFIFWYTDSRTGVVMTASAITLVYLVKINRFIFFRKVIGILGRYVYIVGMIISLCFSMMYSNVDWLRSINTLSARFGSGYYVMQNYSITLFGNAGIVTDFGYVAILYGSGISVFTLYIIGFSALGRRLEERKRYVETIILILYAVYTLAESYSASILMNISLFYLTVLIFPKSEERMLVVNETF